MTEVLMVGVGIRLQQIFAESLKERLQLPMLQVVKGADAVLHCADNKAALVVINETLSDMTGIELIKCLILINPLLNSALISDMDPDRFHEETEGFGVLAQLSQKAEENQVKALLNQLGQIIDACN